MKIGNQGHHCLGLAEWCSNTLITLTCQNKCPSVSLHACVCVKERARERRNDKTQKEETDREVCVCVCACVSHYNYVKAGCCYLDHPSFKRRITSI